MKAKPKPNQNRFHRETAIVLMGRLQTQQALGYAPVIHKITFFDDLINALQPDTTLDTAVRISMALMHSNDAAQRPIRQDASALFLNHIRNKNFMSLDELCSVGLAKQRLVALQETNTRLDPNRIAWEKLAGLAQVSTQVLTQRALTKG